MGVNAGGRFVLVTPAGSWNFMAYKDLLLSFYGRKKSWMCFSLLGT